MSTYIYSIDIPVRDYELDSEGIVNNANYLHYLEYTRHEFCKDNGLSFKAMTDKGIIPVVSRAEIDYKAPLRSGEIMTSRLWVEQKGVRFIFHQNIVHKDTGIVAIDAIVTIVCTENGKPSRGKQLTEVFGKLLK